VRKGFYLGVDVGSVSTNLVLMDDGGAVREKLYLKTGGRPVETLKTGLSARAAGPGGAAEILGAGATGSARQLAGMLIGADVIKNEITAHAVAAHAVVPEVRTVLEIGGQDSKIIFLERGLVRDFAMNTVCAAGTGSFLDRQAARLDIPIEQFGGYALRARNPVRIAGRCAGFAESDMIHKQQSGHLTEDIIAGLCRALVRNYLNNLAKGKKIQGPVVFQGGVAANVGIAAAFEEELGRKILIPQYYDVMGAYGSALLAREAQMRAGRPTRFYGFDSIREDEFTVSSMECRGCSNLCEVVRVGRDGSLAACWGDRCGKWSALPAAGRSGAVRQRSGL
jgi:predicted CoA-substrate-specific enzyme activase